MTDYDILKDDELLVNRVIDFYTSEFSNSSMFLEIKKISEQKASDRNDINSIQFIQMGFFSITDFKNFMSETKEVSLTTSKLEILIIALEKKRILKRLPTIIAISDKLRYNANSDYTKYLFDRKLILNTIYGWNYIIEKYANSVIKIQHLDKNGDYHIGTGFYFTIKNPKNNMITSLIVTNKHVLENAKEIKLFTKNEEEIKFIKALIDENRDIGFVLLKKQLEKTSTFHFNPKVEILSEIVTIGYPSIPMTKECYQVYHKGEINSFVEDYENNKLFLFSAKTSSGNSGSPILDKYGMVVGMVTEELFEQKSFYEKGKLPYYAGIPTSEIIESANETVFIGG